MIADEAEDGERAAADQLRAVDVDATSAADLRDGVAEPVEASDGVGLGRVLEVFAFARHDAQSLSSGQPAAPRAAKMRSASIVSGRDEHERDQHEQHDEPQRHAVEVGLHGLRSRSRCRRP